MRVVLERITLEEGFTLRCSPRPSLTIPVRLVLLLLAAPSIGSAQDPVELNPGPSVARLWNEQLLGAIRIETMRLVDQALQVSLGLLDIQLAEGLPTRR